MPKLKRSKRMDLANFKYDIKVGKGGVILTSLLEPKTEFNKSAVKKYKKLTAVIEVGDHYFDSDEDSINFMSSIVALANFKFNQAVASGVSASDAFDAVYSQTITWKDNNGEGVELTLQQIGEGLELGMQEMSKIIYTY